MALIKDTAIVLRRLDYSETSQVLAVFTRLHGQQRLIAKGIKRGTKKRVAVGVDLLELGRVVFSQRPGKEATLSTLTEWHQEEAFAHLRRDLSRCYAAQYAAEVTSQLTEVHDPHPALFDALRRLLSELAHAAALPALVDFLWLLLKEIGLRPELSTCVNCNRRIEDEKVLYFSSRQGGAVCRDCESAIIEKRRIDPALARAFSVGHWRDDDQAAAGFDLLDYHLTETMSRPAKLSGMLRTALNLSDANSLTRISHR